MKREGALLLCTVASLAAAFELPNPFRAPPAFLPKTPSSSVAKLKAELLDAISFTSNGKNASPETQKKVLSIVGSLEKQSPPSPTLLSDPQEAQALDGVWYLQYTSPSVVGDKDEFPNEWKPAFASEGDSNIETKQFNAKGTVAAVGITVDTSRKVVKQTFDIQQSRVTNDVELDFGRVKVAGTFRQSPNVPNRAIVAFEEANIELKNGLKLKLGFIFAALALFRGGSKDSGWLETTFLDEDMRIGRGNKGTMFVLTRDVDAVKP